MDSAYIFKQKVSSNPDFCKMFPDEIDQLDLKQLSLLHTQGRYKDDSPGSGGASQHSGLLTLFRDIDRMISNAKCFNDCNRNFQIWRLADVAEKNILYLKQELSSRLQLPELLSNLQEEKDELNNETSTKSLSAIGFEGIEEAEAV